MVWRAAAAIELGICQAVLCAIPANYLTPMSPQRPYDPGDALYYGASSFRYGSPQAEFEIPYGYLGQNGPYAQVAQMYAAGIRIRRGGDGQDRRRPTGQRQPHPRCGVPGQTAEHRRRAGQPHHRLAAAHAGDRACPAWAVPRCSSPTPIWRARAATGRCGSRDSANACRTSHRYTPPIRCRPRWSRSPSPPSAWPVLRPRHGHGVDLRLLHHHRAAHPGRRRVLREGQGHAVRHRP